ADGEAPAADARADRADPAPAPAAVLALDENEHGRRGLDAAAQGGDAAGPNVLRPRARLQDRDHLDDRRRRNRGVDPRAHPPRADPAVAGAPAAVTPGA